jgi:hypothetical protein
VYLDTRHTPEDAARGGFLMADLLIPDTLWDLIEPLLPASRRSRTVADHVHVIVHASQAFCSYSEVAFPGGCCRKNWAAAPA